MRIQQSVGYLHNNNGNSITSISTSAGELLSTSVTTTVNNIGIETINNINNNNINEHVNNNIIPTNDVEQQTITNHQNTIINDNEENYFNNNTDSTGNVTISNNSIVTFTKNINNFNQLNRTRYNLNLNHNNNFNYNNNNNNINNNNINNNNNIINLNDNKSVKIYVNDNERQDQFMANLSNNNQCENIDSNINDINENTTINLNSNNNNNFNIHSTVNSISRANLAKLDLDTNIEHHIRRDDVGGEGSSIYSESSPDDSFMDDEDAYSPTASSCESPTSPQHQHFPRGIINPNYPGFQHLAHTLSEHYIIDHNIDNSSSDSDQSDIEIELIKDNLAENNNNNNNDYDDNNNNNINNNNIYNNNNNNNDDEEHLNHQQIDVNNDQKNTEEEATAVMVENNQTVKCIEFNQIDENITCNLETYLKLYEPSMQSNENLNTTSLVDPNDIEKEISASASFYSTPDILIKSTRNSIDDDPVNDENQQNRKSQPDILQNVIYLNNVEASPSASSMSNDNSMKLESLPSDVKPINIPTNELPAANENQPITFTAIATVIAATTSSCTPIDIVGNFGQEVEHEFGLLLSGYKNYSNESSETDDFPGTYENDENVKYFNRGGNDVENSNEVAINKMNDAVLSNAKETITAVAVSNVNDEVREHIVNKIYRNNIHNNNNNHQDLKIQLEKSTNLLSSSSSPRSSSSSSSSSSSNQNNFDNTCICDNYNRNSLSLPTAIVKPKKYKRQSYDDRQLPPVVSIDREKPWFDNNNAIDLVIKTNNKNDIIQSLTTSASVSSLVTKTTTTTTTTIANIKKNPFQQQQQQHQQKLPHFERKHKKFVRNINHHQSLPKTAGGNVNVICGPNSFISEKEKNNSHRQSEKDIDSSNNNSSVVAIVTPRKRDKMEFSTNHHHHPQQYSNDEITLQTNNMLNNINDNNNNNNTNINSHNTTINSNNNNNNSDNLNSNLKNNLINDSKNNNITQYCDKGYKTKVMANDSKDNNNIVSAGFDVYNIETALPVIDLEAIENHLRVAKEEERRKRNDREEIRRRLAMGAEDDYFSRLQSDKPGRKPSLHSRLQGGMNLQICFMNETASDTESPSSDSESCPKLSKSITFSNHSASTANGDNGRNYNGGATEGAHFNTRSISVNNGIAYNKKNPNERVRPTSLPIGPAAQYPYDDSKDIDFFTIQARLQIEARMALAQAKDMAHMQMEVDRQRQQQSPITAIIRNSLEKVGIPLSPEKRRVSRQMLTNMNIAQLQIIVNELHTEFERLSEYLVKYLLDRDDLHMSQDSKLVDIEDLTRYLGAKEQGIDYPSACNLLEQHQQEQQQPTVATIHTTTATTTTTSTAATTLPERPVSATLQIRKEPIQFYNNIKNIDNNDIMKRINASTTTISATNTTATKPQTQNKLLRIASLVKK